MRNAREGINSPDLAEGTEDSARHNPPTQRDDGLPEGVDAEEAIQQLVVPRTPGHRHGLPRSSIARTYRYLRESDEEVSVKEIMREVYGNSYLERSFRMTPPDWFRQIVADYLPRLPGVRNEGNRWMFDPTAAERPPFKPGKTLRKPSEEEADANLREFDYPGRTHQDAIDHYQAVKSVYEELREKRRLTRGGIYEHHSPATVRKPELGKFDASDEWYAMLAYPALEQLPDTEPPVMPAGEWRYIGLDRAETDTEEIEE